MKQVMAFYIRSMPVERNVFLNIQALKKAMAYDEIKLQGLLSLKIY